MIKQLLFFRNGNVWASDERGFPVEEEQEPAWLIVIRDKLARGVIDDDTLVMRSHYSDMRVGEILRCRKFMDGKFMDELLPDFSTRERKGGEDLNDKYIKIAIDGPVGPNALPTEITAFRERLVKDLASLGWKGTGTFACGDQVVNLAEATTAASH